MTEEDNNGGSGAWSVGAPLGGTFLKEGVPSAPESGFFGAAAKSAKRMSNSCLRHSSATRL